MFTPSLAHPHSKNTGLVSRRESYGPAANLAANWAKVQVEVEPTAPPVLCALLAAKATIEAAPRRRKDAAALAHAHGFAYYIGGRHVAIHARKAGTTENEIEGPRLALVIGIGPDWS